MRTISTDMERILTSPVGYSVNTTIQIEDADGNLQDYSDFKSHNWLLECTITDDIDALGPTATVVLQKAIFNDNLSYAMEGSRLNLDLSLTFAERINLRREIIIFVECEPLEGVHSGNESEKVELFRGQIDVIDLGDDTITLTCRDQICDLADTWIETDTLIYSSDFGEPVENVMQEILDGWIVFPIDTPTLFVPVSPLWNIRTFQSSKEPVSEQLTALASQIGWNVRYKWDNGDEEFKLTLYEPDRGSVVTVRTFTPSQFYSIEQLSLSIESIRNKVTIFWPDPDDINDEGDPNLLSITRSSPASQALYGTRWMSITEASTSNINDSVEADLMATAIVADLAFPQATHQVKMPFFFAVELEDVYEFTANNDYYDTDIACAIVGYSHNLTSDTFETTLTMRQNGVIGRSFDSWHDYIAAPGISLPTLEKEARVGSPSAPLTSGGFALSWQRNNFNLDSAEIANNVFYSIHATPVGGSVSPSSLVAVTRSTFASVPTGVNVPVDEDFDLHIIASNRSVETAEEVLTVHISPFGDKHFNENVLGDGIGAALTFNQETNGSAYVADGIDSVEEGTWGVNASIDDGTDFGTGPGTAPHGPTGLLIL